MKVAWFLTDLAGGGAERLPLILAPYFRETSLHLVLLKNHVQHALPVPPPRLTALLPAEARLGRSAWRLLRAAIEASRDADLLVGGMEWDSTLAAVAAGLWLRRPVVAIVHTDLHRLYATLSIPAWRWRLFARPWPKADGYWVLLPWVYPYFWWQRPGWDFNEFGIEFGVGVWGWQAGIRDND